MAGLSCLVQDRNDAGAGPMGRPRFRHRPDRAM